jgi:hypothetical protein
MPETLNFYVSEDFQLKLGKKQVLAIVPRMKFLTGGAVIAKIAEVQASDIKGAIELLFKAKNGDESAVSDIKNTVAGIIVQKNDTLMIEILSMVSEGAITKTIIEETECQYAEVIAILFHLIEANFSSLKNLSASLKAITSSGQ